MLSSACLCQFFLVDFIDIFIDLLLIAPSFIDVQIISVSFFPSKGCTPFAFGHVFSDL